MSGATRTNFILVFALWAAGLGAAAQFGKMSVIYNDLGEIYQNTGAALGFIVSVVGVIGIIFGTTSGLLIDRFGYRKTLLWALILGAAMSAFQATLPPMPIMLISRVIEGFSHLAIVVAAPTLIAQISRQKHFGIVMTIWGSFFGVSYAITAWLGGMLVAANGVEALLLAHAIFMTVMVAILWPILPKVKVTTSVEPISLVNILKQHAEIYKSPFISAPAFGWLFYATTFVALLTFLPNYVPTDQKSFVASVMPLASIAVSLTLGVLLLRFMSAVTLILVGFFAACCVLCLFFIHSDYVLLAIVLAGVLGLVQGASFAAVPQLNHVLEDRSKANGAMAQLGNVGTTCGTPLYGATMYYIGMPGIILLTILLYLAASFAHILLVYLRQRTAS